MTTTGERLVSISTLTTDTALNHFLNISTGTGSGTIIINEICTLNPYAVTYIGEESRAITYVPDDLISFSYIEQDPMFISYLESDTYSLRYLRTEIPIEYVNCFNLLGSIETQLIQDRYSIYILARE